MEGVTSSTDTEVNLVLEEGEDYSVCPYNAVTNGETCFRLTPLWICQRCVEVIIAT